MSGIVGDGSVYTCKHLMRVKKTEECVFCHRDQLQQENERLRAALQAAVEDMDAHGIIRDNHPAKVALRHSPQQEK
jgi:hypothetical protein